MHSIAAKNSEIASKKGKLEFDVILIRATLETCFCLQILTVNFKEIHF